MDDIWLQLILPLIIAVLGSSGFWAYMQSRGKISKANTQLLMGMAYDKLTYKGLRYLERGWLTKDEFEEFYKFLYLPYKTLGGNGVAEQIAAKVAQLPLKPTTGYQLLNEKRHRRVVPREREPTTGYKPRHEWVADQFEQHGI